MATQLSSPLAECRLAAGYTQESFAEKLGVDRSTIGRWERGTQSPQPWQRPDLATALNISLDQLDDLLRRTKQRHPAATADPAVSGSGSLTRRFTDEGTVPGDDLLSAPGTSVPPVEPIALRTAMVPVQPPSGDECRTETATGNEQRRETQNEPSDSAPPAIQDLPAHPVPLNLNDLANLAAANLALLLAVTNGTTTAPGDERRTDLDRLVDIMKRRGLIQLAGRLAAGGALTLPALDGLQLLGELDLDPDEQERVTKAIDSPVRVDEQVIGHIETMHYACKRQDDTFGPKAVLNIVLGQQRLVRNTLLPACPDSLRPRLLSLYSSLCDSTGWYFFDLNNFELAWGQFEKARKSAHESRNTELGIHTLLNMSYAVSWHGKPHIGIDLAMVAQGLAAKTDDMLLKVCVAADTAVSYATDGQYDECVTELGKAQTLLAASPGQAPSESLAYGINEGYLADSESLCMLRLERPRQAIVSARAGLESFDRSFTRSLAFCSLQLGKALVQSKEIDEAAAVIADAAALAAQTRSARLAKELRTVRASMQPWRDTRAVRELDERLVGLSLGTA